MSQKMSQNALNLGARLRMCADFVRPGARLADIGTDHGYIPIALLQSGKVPFAVASDINPGPLKSAEQHAAQYAAADRMRFVLCDGLHGVEPSEADDIVIAGMGGELILRIIGETPWLCTPEKHLVLQPMTTAAQLRTGLLERGFEIEREEAVYDEKKIYSVLSVFYTGVRQTDVPLLLAYMGKIQPGSLNSARYARSVEHNISNKIKGLRHTGGDTGALEALRQSLLDIYMKGWTEYDS
ncbi:MAG: class I SAM-dependent methyltransferase [Hominenteromicrobium sp.]